MKRLAFFVLLGFFVAVNAQQYGFKYWEMRQRFLDKFIRVGEGHGMSIPAAILIKRSQEIDYLTSGMNQPGRYLAVLLSTEHKLLNY